MSRYDDLIATVEAYQDLASENYLRVRRLAESLASGFCAYLGTDNPPCVILVPPAGPFEPKSYGDQAFSIPPQGFRPLGPILFGLAVRVSRAGHWIRVTMECRKVGDAFIVQIQGGPEQRFDLPLEAQDPSAMFDLIYQHVFDWFRDQSDRYQQGEFGAREIGFDFSDAAKA
ncbi:MAG: hypothetical protein AAFQ67_00435 [Pseudomonadota bacterium]